MNTLRTICFCCSLTLAAPVAAYDGLRDENPFVEAMLRMMEVFGLIDRSRLPLSVPYLPGYSPSLGGLAPMYGPGGLGSLGTLGALPGVGGLSGLGAMPGLGGVPGMTALPGLGGVPGMTALPGLGGVPGMTALPGLGGVPGMGAIPGTLMVPGTGLSQAPLGGWPTTGMQGIGGLPGLGGQQWQQWPNLASTPAVSLDGIWELNNGGVVIIRGDRARLYLSRDRYQDFVIAYDRQQLSWAPLRGGTASRYRYQVRDDRMVMQDKDGNYLLLRRRR